MFAASFVVVVNLLRQVEVYFIYDDFLNLTDLQEVSCLVGQIFASSSTFYSVNIGDVVNEASALL